MPDNDEEKPPFSKAPEVELVQTVEAKLHVALRSLQERNAAGLYHQLSEGIRSQLFLLTEGKPAFVITRLEGSESGTDPIITALTKEFGVELPYPGRKGLIALREDLEKPGQESQRVRFLASSHWQDNPLTSYDIATFLTQPTLILQPITSEVDLKELALPTNNEHIRLMFGGTGITHPDNQAGNPITLRFFVLPPKENVRL